MGATSTLIKPILKDELFAKEATFLVMDARRTGTEQFQGPEGVVAAVTHVMNTCGIEAGRFNAIHEATLKMLDYFALPEEKEQATQLVRDYIDWMLTTTEYRFGNFLEAK